MIDHMLAFATEADAINDSVVGQYHTLSWAMNCIPNVLVWDPANDTTDTGFIVHHPIDNQFRVVITSDKQIRALALHPRIELVADHVAIKVNKTTFTALQRATLHMQPVFAGSNYPFLLNPVVTPLRENVDDTC